LAKTRRSGKARSQSTSRVWAVRVVVWSAFLVVVSVWGPRGVAVLQGRVAAAGRASPPVELDLVGFVQRPAWVDDSLLVAISRDLQPWLCGSMPILAEAPARQLVEGLATVSWIVDARLERVHPDRFRVHFGLRRPVLAVRDELFRPLCLADRHGVALPWVEGIAVPDVVLRREGGAGSVVGEIGSLVPDDRVVAAAAIAVEWREEIAPRVTDCPELVEIDVTNLGERWVRSPHYPEVRVGLRREDGAKVMLGYGRPCGSSLPRVSANSKAGVLTAILAASPGLGGLVAGDLRFEVRWRSWLQPRQGS